MIIRIKDYSVVTLKNLLVPTSKLNNISPLLRYDVKSISEPTLLHSDVRVGAPFTQSELLCTLSDHFGRPRTEFVTQADNVAFVDPRTSKVFIETEGAFVNISVAVPLSIVYDGA